MTVTFVNSDSDQKQESSSSSSSSSNNNPQQDESTKKDDANSEPTNESTINKDIASSPIINFPVDDLQRLDEMLNRTRWIVPVLPKNELETLLDASIALCRDKLDTKSEHCQRFFRDGLQLSFVRILTDDAVNTWKNDIYKHIYNNTLKGIELCTLKMLDDWFPLLELLALIFNPQCKYHVINSMRSTEMIVKVNISDSLTEYPIKDNKSKLKKVKQSNGGDDLVSSDENIDDEENDGEIELEDRLNYDEMIEEQDDDLIDELNDEEDEDDEDEEDSDDNLSVYSGQSDSNEKIADEAPKDSIMADLDEIVNDVIVKSSLDDDNNNTSKTKSVKKNSKNKKNTKQSKQTTNKQNSTNKKLLNSNLSNITTNSSLLNTKNELSLSKLSDSNSNKGDTSLNNNSNNNNNNSNEQVPEIQENVPSPILYTTYARSYLKAPYGWLIDFINYFGQLDGFKLLLERFTNNVKLNIQVIAALLKPWGLCYQFLTPYTVKTYFLPIIEIVPKFFENLTDEDIKKECKSENKNDSISTVIKWLKLLATRVQNQEELCKNLEILRLKTILRILKFASFNGKMNALNEVNKVISNITYNIQIRGTGNGGSSTGSSSSCSNRNDSNEEWLTSDRMAKWIQENDVLDIVLSDCMHQPQYVEKLEKILRFLIKEKQLTLKDLDKIWESQLGKHEAIEKNVHDLLSKLAWDFTPEQLDHLFSCFQKSWTNASKKQREKLLDLIRSLSEDDKEGVMANKVLDLLWNLAHSDDAPTEIIDQAVAAHIKILDYSCSSDKESQKLKYLEKCIEQLKDNKWVIVSLRQIREILQQYPEIVTGSFQTQRLINYSQNSSSSNINSNSNSQTNANNNSNSNQNNYYRPDIIAKLQKEYSLISMITANLANYYESIRRYVKENGENIDSDTILSDGRFNHSTQIQERLHFLKYLLKEGQLWLCSAQAETIWKCLAQNSVFESDREICFKWFSKLMTDDPDLEPDMNKTFFVNYVTKLDPKLLTDSGIKCFDRFFKTVNLKYDRLVQKRNYFLTESLDLIGIDYLWKIVSFANEEIVEKAILLLKDIYIHLGPQLKSEQCAIHADLISNCMDRLRVSHDNLTILVKNKSDKNDELKYNQEITQILRVMIVLREYLNEFDANYLCERVFPPLSRASKGKSILMYVRLQIQNRQADDIELISHINETVGSLRRQIYFKTKLNPQVNKIDLIINNECIECVDDNKVLSEYQLKEKMFIVARVTQTSSSSSSGLGNNSSNSISGGGNMNSGGRLDSSGDSSSDDCGSSNEDTHNVINAPSIEHELMLPSVILSLNDKYVQFLIELADFGCKINNTQIKECTRGIIDLLPIAKHTSERIKQICRESINHNSNKLSISSGQQLENLYYNCSQTQCWYYLKVTHALLIPAMFMYNYEENKQIQENFILAGGVNCFKNMLIKDQFLQSQMTDDNTKKAALLYVLKINKLTMTTVCHSIYSFVLNAVSNKQFSSITESQHNHALLLQNSVPSIPSNTNEITIRNLAQRLGQQFSSLLVNNVPDLSHIIRLERIAWSLAANGTLNLVTSQHEQIHDSLISNKSSEIDNIDDINVCREALECLSLSLCLVPNGLETLNQEKHWRTFIIDLVLLCSNRLIRQTASEQFLLIALKCSMQPNRPIQFFIQMLFTCLISLNKNAQQSQEYFFLLCRLLNCANLNNVQISNTETLLNNEIIWLKKVKQLSLQQQQNDNNNKSENNKNNEQQDLTDEMLLDGHLNLTKELLLFQNAEKKYLIGCHPQGNILINELIEYFLFPSSYLFKQYRDSLQQTNNLESNYYNFEQLLASKSASLKSICSSSMTIVSAFDLLVSLCTGCLHNFKDLSDLIFQLFYPSLLNSQNSNGSSSSSSSSQIIMQQHQHQSDQFLSNDCTIAQNEWEYIPPIGQRPHNGFVGLKNAGATCYMNSVLQQLFMIKAIRNFILSVDTSNVEFASKQNINATQSTAAVTSSSSIFDDLDDTTTENHNNLELSSRSVNNNVVMSEDDQRKEYNMSIFRHLQMIYGHLAESKMQYYVPKGFWRQFRFGNERVNLREQHDAVEFFNSVVDCIDESMKSISKEQICSKILGGTFADQKICKGCPHRYSREESFTLLSVDVKHSQRLSESLEQYVKGDLLEGPNAYHCEKCNKKIDAVKRTCIKKLPLVLAIQLKRFDYDWEREIAVKSNEYFEFPRELDMDPYTVKGVARIERQQELIKKRQQEIAASQTSGQNNPQIQIFNANSKIDDMDLYEDEEENDENSVQFSNKYRLVGIVVHSGQANGGHYYSFIQTKSNNDGLEEESSPSGKDDENNSTSTNSSYNNWYKFDDGEVSEFKMDDEEMRNQCYGGDYTGEVYDNIMKRMAYKKQKRWWNAYILFYERIKLNDNINKSINENITDSMEIKSGSLVHQNQLLYNYQSVKMPSFILRSVHKKNIKFSHHRHHFSVEYFQFIKKLTQANLCLCQNDTPLNDEAEELCLASVNLALKFLFGVGFRVKKTLRGAVNDWYEILFNYAKFSFKARQYMIKYLFIENSVFIAQYFLDCPSNEIRNALSKLLVALTHLSYNDPPLAIKLNDLLNNQQQPSISVLVSSQNQPQQQDQDPSTDNNNKLHFINQSDTIIQTLLSILSKRDLINEQSSKYLIQYFQYFNYYSTLGIQQCLHLIKFDVPLTLMLFALDELPTTLSNINLNSALLSSSTSSTSGSFGLNYSRLSNNMHGSGNNTNSNCTSQYADLNKLYCVISTLLRCYDVSPYCQPSQQDQNSNNNVSLGHNPYSHYAEIRLQQQSQENSTSNKQLQPNIIVKIPSKIEELLFKRSNYLKKLLDDAPNLEETVKLVKFLCWENMNFTVVLLNELLWMAAYHYSYELKPHLELLYHILTINDSWQLRRIVMALTGIQNDREGLFEIIFKSQNHYQKRAYQVIKMLVQLFSTCDLAIDLLNKDEDLKKKWKQSRSWFFHEMEKCRMYNMPNYSYFQSPQSNETSQTYFLERTQSARLTLEKAMRICPQNMNSSSSSNIHNKSANEETNQQRSGSNDNNNDEEDAYESISDDDNNNLDAKISNNIKSKDSSSGKLNKKTNESTNSSTPPLQTPSSSSNIE